MSVQRRALVLILAGSLAFLFSVWRIGNDEQKYVYPALGQPIERSTYDKRVEVFATQLDRIQVRKTLLAIYSQNPEDIDLYDNEGSQLTPTTGHSQEYLKIFGKLRAVPTISVIASEKSALLHIDDEGSISRSFPYIFLVNQEGAVTPVYRIAQGSGFKIDHRNLETRQPLVPGTYTLVIVDMLDVNEESITQAQSVTAYHLDLLTTIMPPTNKGADNSWIFTSDQEFLKKMNPFVMGQHIFAKPELAEAPLGIRPGEETIVISADYDYVEVSFPSQSKPIKFPWQRFQAEAIR